jgi:hypothetical protein
MTGKLSGRLRRVVTDPLVPLALLGGGVFVVLAVPVAPALTWAVLGGLAGYSLSGSV